MRSDRPAVNINNQQRYTMKRFGGITRVLRSVISAVFVMAAALPCQAAAYEVPTIDELLPETLSDKLSISLQLRYRFEYRDNFDFNGHRDDKDGFQLLRTRLNVDLTPVEHLRAFVQLQDARMWDSKFTNEAGFEDSLDLRQGFVEIRGLPIDAFSLRVGRQELSYGDQRLIGAFDWSNVAQSFDAVKLTYDTGLIKADAFASRRVIIDDDNFNKWDDDDNFLGIYATFVVENKDLPGSHTADVYYLFRDTRKPVVFGPRVGSGQLDESTLGARLVGDEVMGFDYGLEAAFQFGNFGDKDIEAFMVNALAGYTFALPWTPRVGVEWNHGSGDSDPGDNTRETFDNLFPTNHLHYGYMDRAGLQNLNDYRVKLSAKPLEGLYLQADAHFLFLDETSDSFYGADKVAVRTSATTAVNDEIGTELDFLAKYRFSRMLDLLAGYSYFFAGDYLSHTGSGDNGEFFYIQATISL